MDAAAGTRMDSVAIADHRLIDVLSSRTSGEPYAVWDDRFMISPDLVLERAR